jgi:hypothetical protein
LGSREAFAKDDAGGRLFFLGSEDNGAHFPSVFALLYEFTSASSAVATHEQRNCRSSGKVLNLQIVLDWFNGAISPMAKS